MLYALRRPASIRALLLWRVTGGAFAVQRLAENYYGQYLKLVQDGGMAAVCESEHFRAQLVERLAWAVCDADAIEGADGQTDG